MKTIKDTPGEAVLDWPFCVAGGNGVGTDLLGRFYHLNNAVGFMQRYHGKKIVGNYFGRLSMTQITPFLVTGWDKMFHPDHPSYFKARQQAKPMTEQEWAFFDKFYTLNDFCGISLYPSLLAPGDPHKFYQRFGKPKISATVAGGLEAVFIPKDNERRRLTNKLEGKKSRYLISLEPGEQIDLVKSELPPEISATGWFRLTNSEAGLLRYAGNKTELVFNSETGRVADLAIICFIKSTTTLIINDNPHVFEQNKRGYIRFKVRKGMNRIKILSEEKDVATIAFKELKILMY
jgi:hypothetical protein